jgi:hypothetical protein
MKVTTGWVSFAVGFRVSACCGATVRRWCHAEKPEFYACARCHGRTEAVVESC